MITSIKSLIARIRQQLFEIRLESEFYGGIAPHIRHEKQEEYPFSTREELAEASRRAMIDAKAMIDGIDRLAGQLPKAYGHSFRYVACRDIMDRLAMYEMLGRRRVPPKHCDPRFVARPA